MKTLADAAVGESMTITKIGGDGAIRRRIMDLGLTKGAELSVRKVAPLGDPIQITIRGTEVSIRRDDAMMVEVG